MAPEKQEQPSNLSEWSTKELQQDSLGTRMRQSEDAAEAVDDDPAARQWAARVRIEELEPSGPQRHNEAERAAAIDDVVSGYEPFMPSEKVGGLRQLSDDELKLSDRRQRELIRERIADLRREVGEQHEKVAELTLELYQTIEEEPDVVFDDLWALISKSAPAARLNDEVLGQLYEAAESYTIKHATVKRYREQYPDDRDLLAAALGVTAEDDFQVAQGPMSLAFRFKSTRDFTAAFRQKNQIDSGDTKDDLMRRTGGGALAYVTHAPELGGCVLVENAASTIWEPVPVAYEGRLAPGDAEPVMLAGLETLTIGKTNHEAWVVRRASERGDVPLLYEIASTRYPERPLATFGTNQDQQFWEEGKEEPHFALHYDSAALGDAPFTLDLAWDRVSVHSQSEQDLSLDLKSLALVPQDRADPDWASDKPTAITDHEIQHLRNVIANKRPKPLEWDDICDIVADSPRLEEAADRLVLEWARDWRVREIDRQAWDEIIAFVAGGSPMAEIRKALTQYEAYQYETVHADAIKDITGQITDFGQRVLADAWRVPKAQALDPERAQQLVGQVMGGEYRQQLERALGSVEQLLDKGYARDKVIALLQQMPVREWSTMAWNMKDQSGTDKRWLRASTEERGRKRGWRNLFGLLGGRR